MSYTTATTCKIQALGDGEVSLQSFDISNNVQITANAATLSAQLSATQVLDLTSVLAQSASGVDPKPRIVSLVAIQGTNSFDVATAVSGGLDIYTGTYSKTFIRHMDVGATIQNLKIKAGASATDLTILVVHGPAPV